MSAIAVQAQGICFHKTIFVTEITLLSATSCIACFTAVDVSVINALLMVWV